MRFSLVALVGVLVLSACTDGTDTPSAPTLPSTVPAWTAAAAPGEVDLDDETERPEEHVSRAIARRVPGFGGISTDSTGAVILFLVNPSNAGEERSARSLASEYVNRQARAMRDLGIRTDVIVRKADFTFAQLSRYRRRTNESILATPGVLFTDLDELVNRYVIGIERAREATARDAVRRIISSRGVPETAVEFEVRNTELTPACDVYDVDCQPTCEPWTDTCNDPCATDPLATGCTPIEPEPATNSLDIREAVRPIVGGVKIQNQSLGSHGTIGFVARYCVEPELSSNYSGCRYFYVVASHQTNYQSLYDGARFYQPNTFYGGEFAAVEAIDPPWHTYPFSVNVAGLSAGTTCEPYTGYSSFVCRRSDMALLEPKEVSYSFGYLVRPAVRRSDTFYDSNQFAINASNPRIRISDEAVITPGNVVDKIGVTTGWRSGRVERVCVDVQRVIQEKVYRFILRCQTEMSIHSDQGDSGGPVFRYNSDGTASLAGVHHGRVTPLVPGEVRYQYYSPMSTIRNDLGIAYNDRIGFSVVPGGI